jgi:hypothetical protein
VDLEPWTTLDDLAERGYTTLLRRESEPLSDVDKLLQPCVPDPRLPVLLRVTLVGEVFNVDLKSTIRPAKYSPDVKFFSAKISKNTIHKGTEGK